MRRTVGVIVLMVIPALAMAGGGGYRVTYDGGSLSGTKPGAGLKLYFNSEHIWLLKGRSDLVAIPDAAVTEISYGQDVHRRVGTAVAVGVVTLGLGALTALAKSKKHYIGLTWKDGNSKGGIALRCDKKDYRGILVGLEGVTGKKVIDADAMTVKN